MYQQHIIDCVALVRHGANVSVVFGTLPWILLAGAVVLAGELWRDRQRLRQRLLQAEIHHLRT